MTLSDLNQITATMQLLNKLGDRRELPPEKCSAAVLALADCMGCQRPDKVSVVYQSTESTT